MLKNGWHLIKITHSSAWKLDSYWLRGHGKDEKLEVLTLFRLEYWHYLRRIVSSIISFLFSINLIGFVTLEKLLLQRLRLKMVMHIMGVILFTLQDNYENQWDKIYKSVCGRTHDLFLNRRMINFILSHGHLE